MMETMRSMATGWVAKILMGLLVLSFAVWGIADIFTGFGRGTVATVGDTEIDAQDYRAELNTEINALSNRLNQRLTVSQTAAFGLPNQVLGRMIAEATLNDMATRYNLGLSSEELARTIASDPAFQNLGKFDRDYMNLILRNLGTTEDRYVLSREGLEQRRQLAAGLTGLSTVPNAALKVFNAFTFEKRDVNYVVLKEEDLPAIEEPSDEALAKYFDDKKLVFRAPEYRSFELLKLEPGDIIDPDGVSDEDAKGYYETAASRFIQEEKRQIQQILFGSPAEAREALDKIRAGSDFDDIVAERNLTPEDIDFGLLTKAEVTDPAVADAAFALQEGDISEVIAGRFGSLLVRVAEIQPEQAQPFEELKDQLKAEIAADRAKDEVLDMFDKVEDARAGGSTLKEIANQLNLPYRTITAISRDGELQNEEKLTDLPEQTALLTNIFDTEIDYEADPIDVANTGFAWFHVKDIIPARDRTLDEVRVKVIDAWKKDERASQNANLASEILKEVQGGLKLEDVASQRNLAFLTAKAITRQGGGSLPGSAIDQAFGGPLGHGATAAGSAEQFVLQVAAIEAPDFSPDALQLDGIRQSLNDSAANDLLGQLTTDIQRSIGITINQPLLDQLTSAGQ